MKADPKEHRYVQGKELCFDVTNGEMSKRTHNDTGSSTPKRLKSVDSQSPRRTKEDLRGYFQRKQQDAELFIDGSSNRQGAEAGIVLVSPDGQILEQSIRLGFKASNNEVVYEALIAGLKLATAMEADEVEDFLYEIHEGICGSHTGGRSLTHRAISQGYWWPYMQKDAEAYGKKCEQCQRFAPLIHQLAADLNPVLEDVSD
ncbi:uncharacterized protein LOC114256828 [Camellia sinensis]|uniref:uncharacterized protein LOC114256828 n=1 Tax=Camellia sinensis TaxID=4442 RepID=UPI0010358C79|nr:uncharacterized protein LOC114256828 [Camellia sinensis]